MHGPIATAISARRAPRLSIASSVASVTPASAPFQPHARRRRRRRRGRRTARARSRQSICRARCHGVARRERIGLGPCGKVGFRIDDHAAIAMDLIEARSALRREGQRSATRRRFSSISAGIVARTEAAVERRRSSPVETPPRRPKNPCAMPPSGAAPAKDTVTGRAGRCGPRRYGCRRGRRCGRRRRNHSGGKTLARAGFR